MLDGQLKSFGLSLLNRRCAACVILRSRPGRFFNFLVTLKGDMAFKFIQCSLQRRRCHKSVSRVKVYSSVGDLLFLTFYDRAHSIISLNHQLIEHISPIYDHVRIIESFFLNKIHTIFVCCLVFSLAPNSFASIYEKS